MSEISWDLGPKTGIPRRFSRFPPRPQSLCRLPRIRSLLPLIIVLSFGNKCSLLPFIRLRCYLTLFPSLLPLSFASLTATSGFPFHLFISFTFSKLILKLILLTEEFKVVSTA